MDGPPAIVRWQIEPLTAARSIEAGRLVEHVLGTEFGAALAVCSDSDLADMHGTYFRPGSMAWVVIADEEVIGVAAVQDTPAGALLLRRFYLRAPWRARGIGGALLGVVHAWAQAESYQQITLVMTDRMAVAMAFYRRNGYEEIGTEERDGVALHHFRRTAGARPIGTVIELEKPPAAREGEVAVVIERPRRLVEEWHWDDAGRRVVLTGYYPVPVPVNYGLALGWVNPADGEPLDVIVLDDRRMEPGQALLSRPVGVLWRPDGDHKLLVEPGRGRLDRAPRPVEVDDAYRERVSSWWDRAHQPLGWSGLEGVPRLMAQSRRR